MSAPAFHGPEGHHEAARADANTSAALKLSEITPHTCCCSPSVRAFERAHGEQQLLARLTKRFAPFPERLAMSHELHSDHAEFLRCRIVTSDHLPPLTSFGVSCRAPPRAAARACRQAGKIEAREKRSLDCRERASTRSFELRIGQRVLKLDRGSYYANERLLVKTYSPCAPPHRELVSMSETFFLNVHAFYCVRFI
jgi:hypothetical protein